MSTKLVLQDMIRKSWIEYVELHKAEIESGYDDAMDGFDRKEAEGFALGLEASYEIFFGEPCPNMQIDFDPYDYEESLNG